MTTPNLAFLPDAIAGTIQNGILERRLYESMKPALLWRGLASRERHPGRIGELVTKTRDGLIAPDTEASAKRTPGGDPSVVTRSVEQFTYQVAPYGKSVQIQLPASYVAQANRFLADTSALGFHAAQTLGRIARNRLLAAYGGGNTFATTGTTSTSLVVKDATGFDTVMVNGSPVPVSVTNPLPIAIAGTANNVTACNLATNTLTVTSATWSQYDAVVRTDAAKVFRQGSRTSDHLLISSDVASAAAFRAAAASMRSDNVPGLDGSPAGMYGCFVDPQIETSLLADPEIHDAIKAVGLTGPFADGAVGDYAGIRFIRNTEMSKLASDSDYQTTIYRSFMFGMDSLIEAFIPEQAFATEVVPEGIAQANHYKMALDAEGTSTLIVRAPLDPTGEMITASWVGTLDWAVPTDSLNQTGPARYKRCRVIHTAGPT